MTEQGAAPSAAWVAVDTACNQAGIRNPTSEPTPETPSVASGWDTASTMDAVRREREKAAAAAPHSVGADRATAMSAAPDTSHDEVPATGIDPTAARSASRSEETRQAGRATIRQVIAQLRERHPELAGSGDSTTLSPRFGRHRGDHIEAEEAVYEASLAPVGHRNTCSGEGGGVRVPFITEHVMLSRHNDRGREPSEVGLPKGTDTRIGAQCRIGYPLLGEPSSIVGVQPPTRRLFDTLDCEKVRSVFG